MEQRNQIYLNADWETCLGDWTDGMCVMSCEKEWKKVQIPHNWEDYQGYRKLSHGNLHGTAWYRKYIQFPEKKQNEHVFVCFEGVGSYADVYLNGILIGRHEGGLTCFFLELTDALKEGQNLLAVRVSHPEKITNLPWVCGGCFGTPNTEGSQPFGIHRPVSVYRTRKVRLVPFGVGISSTGIKEGHPMIRICTELENLEQIVAEVTLYSRIYNPQGEMLGELMEKVYLNEGEKCTIVQFSREIEDSCLWSLENPQLYRVESVVEEGGEISDRVENTFGMRYIEWENFENSKVMEIDKKKLMEAPGDDNQYFCRYTRGNADSLVGIMTGGVRVTLPYNEPDRTIIRLQTTVVNRDSVAHNVFVESFVQTYNATKSIANLSNTLYLEPGETKNILQDTEELHYLDFWSPEQPVLHGVYTTIRNMDNPLEEYNQTYTSFGICKEDGLVNKGYAYVERAGTGESVRHRFLLNGKHIFINGTAEYQHLLGNDHAFDDRQITARMQQIQAAGFNAFREAHCPHNLRYIDACDHMGILYWAQMGAHLYFDNAEFHDNFMRLTEEFVRERRNCPSLILWGIQNESLLPTFFADDVRQMIRSLDDTASRERLITTCNGGSGSDWNVPQNWCGTYGGSVLKYQKEICKQLLAGEYGQYRVIGRHEEGDCEPRQQGSMNGNVDEELFCYCLENKVRLAEQVREKVYGHFQWIFNSHANPGRETRFCLDGLGLDSVGVVNNKGLLTSWGEPVDAFYMYRSHYVPAQREPMVYIVSHTWPDRFKKAGEKGDITVYSNCDEVELFAGFGEYSYGRLKKRKTGEHYLFRDCVISCNVLTAEGYVEGKKVAEDRIYFADMPDAKGWKDWMAGQPDLPQLLEGKYVYRINCGGGQYTDKNGNDWEADHAYCEGGHGFVSWAMDYEGLPPGLGSERKTFDLINGTRDQELFQSYRYGRDKLAYLFPVENGNYKAELYFIEPWYGIGGGMDCSGWRVFDIAVNEVILKDVDIWKEAGASHMVIKKTIPVQVNDGRIRISFPQVASYQAVISAIAICIVEN